MRIKAVIFGAGKLGIDFYFKIKETEEIVAFIDNNTEKQGKEILGIKILSAEELTKLEIDKIYIASIFHFNEMERQIEKLGFSHSKVSLFPIQVEMGEKVPEMLYQFQEVYRKEEYDETWEQIKIQYHRVKVYELTIDAIGEFIARYFMILETFEKNNFLKVFIPNTPVKRICNKYLLELLGRKIYIVQENNAGFWAYIFKEYLNELDMTEYKKFSSRNNYPSYKVNRDSNNVWFSKEEIAKGEKVFEQIGLCRPYVCLAARTATYNQKTIGHDYSYGYRNMCFDTYRLAVNYLCRQNMETVKMGRMEETRTKMEGCIDYAGLYSDDFMDLYLASECEFMISSMSGIACIPSLFSKPVLIVNAVPVSFGVGGMRYTDKDLYIPKKYYDVNRGRYLSLREMMEVEALCLIYGDRYEKEGIKFIDNTSEEIEASVQEMLERLRDTWQDTVEDQKNYERYLEIYHEMKEKTASNPDVWIGEPMPQRIAATYLRDNLYLLA